MKEKLRKLCWPILRFFETGDQPYRYKSMNRKVLVVVGVLFVGLSLIIGFLAPHTPGFGFVLPLVVFLCVGVVCLIVGTLGSDRAVAKIWGSF